MAERMRAGLWLSRADPRSWGWLTRARPMALYLALFGLVLIVPALLFSAYLIARNAAVERVGRQTQILNHTRTLASNLDREIANILTTLRVLALSPYLSERDFASFHRRAAEALRGTGSYVLLIDRSFHQVLNTRLPFGTSLPRLANSTNTRRVFETKRPQISGIVFGRTAGQHIFNVEVPVLAGEEVEYVLSITRNATTLVEFLAEPSLDGSWTMTLADGDQRILARSRSHREFVGKHLPLEIVAAMKAGTGIETIGLPDGTRGLIAFDRLVLADWRVILSVPLPVFEAPLVDSLRLLVLGGISLLAASLLLAFLFGRVTAQPIRELSRMAKSLGQHGPVRPMQSPLREANEVSTALADASREREAGENQIMLLMRELAHRSKNQLAIIQAMARQTARRSAGIEDFTERFEQRLQGLASALDLVATRAWAGAPLAELVRAQLKPFGEVGTGRIEASGPDVMVGTKAAESIGMALHELATNAAKYGALSVPEGQVAIDWERDVTVEPARFGIRWREIGGPPVRPPAHTGFGQIVIDQMISQALAGEVTLDFHPDGVVWQFVCPVSSLNEPED